MDDKEEKDWTRKELSLRQGVKQLAIAIVEQWIADGKPDKDKKIIDAWIEISKLEE